MSTISSGTPPFERIAHDIGESIRAGRLLPGDRVPSEAEIMSDYGVAKGTVANAIRLLRARGLVETQVGVGTHVAAQAGGAISGPREHTARVSSAQPIYADGETSEILEASILSTGAVAPAVVAACDLPTVNPQMPSETTRIVKRSRKMYRGGELRGICTTWLNWPLIAQQGPRGAELLDRLTSLDKVEGGTTRAVAYLFGVEPTHDTTRVGVRGLPTDLAMHLGMAPGERVLWTLTTRYGGEFTLEVDEWFRTDDVYFA